MNDWYRDEPGKYELRRRPSGWAWFKGELRITPYYGDEKTARELYPMLAGK